MPERLIHSKAPGVEIIVRQKTALRMVEMVGNGELNCALLPATRDVGLAVLPLISEPIVLSCAPGALPNR